MSRSDLLTYGTAAVTASMGFLFGGPAWGFALLLAGLIFISLAHLKPDERDSKGLGLINQGEPSVEERLQFEERKARQRVRIERELALEKKKRDHALYVDRLSKDLQGFFSEMEAADNLGKINAAWLGYSQWLNQKGLMHLGANFSRYRIANLGFERFELHDPKVVAVERRSLIGVMKETELPPREVSDDRL